MYVILGIDSASLIERVLSPKIDLNILNARVAQEL